MSDDRRQLAIGEVAERVAGKPRPQIKADYSKRT